MKFRIGAYLMMLAVIMTLFSACGGDGGVVVGGSTPISVTALSSPVLVNTSTTIVASFANYTSKVKFGSTVHFTVSPPPATFSNVSTGVTARTVTTEAGGLAWVTVRSPSPGKFTVSARSGNFAGHTTVAFINQPAFVRVQAGLNKPIAGLGGLSFNVLSDSPSPTFLNFTSVARANLDVQVTPIPPAAGVDITSVTFTSLDLLNPVNLPSGTLCTLNYLVVDPGVPHLTLADLSAFLADSTTVIPDFFFTVTYFDSVGTKLYP